MNNHDLSTQTIQRFVGIIVFAVALCTGIYTTSRHAQTMPGICDEVAYYYWTEFFDTVILRYPPREGLWESVDAYDHPNISKYIYGSYLYAHNHEYFRLRDVLRQKFGTQCTYPDKSIMQSIWLMRHIAAATGSLVLVCFALILLMATHNYLLSGLLIYLPVQNELFMNTVVRATSDGLCLLFMLISLLLYLLYIKHRKPVLFAAFSISVGLAISTKLTGGIWYIVYPIFEITKLILRYTNRKQMLWRTCVFICISLFIWTIHSPQLIYSPVKSTVRFFQVRRDMILKVSKQNRPDALPTVTKRIQVAYCLFIQPSCQPVVIRKYVYSSTLSPFPILNILLLGIGLFHVVASIMMKKNEQQLLIFIYTITTLSIVFVIPLAWDRYYLPSAVSVMMLQSVGIWRTMRILYRFASQIPRSLHKIRCR